MRAEPTGSPDTILVCIRGNSGSGKSSIARELRRRHGRGCALVEQDYLRRILLRERDLPGGAAPALIAQTARFALDHGYHVVLEGIMHSSRYRSAGTPPRDVLGWSDELVLPETAGLNEAVEAIAAAARLPQTGRDDDLLSNVPSP